MGKNQINKKVFGIYLLAGLLLIPFQNCSSTESSTPFSDPTTNNSTSPGTGGEGNGDPYVGIVAPEGTYFGKSSAPACGGLEYVTADDAYIDSTLEVSANSDNAVITDLCSNEQTIYSKSQLLNVGGGEFLGAGNSQIFTKQKDAGVPVFLCVSNGASQNIRNVLFAGVKKPGLDSDEFKLRTFFQKREDELAPWMPHLAVPFSVYMTEPANSVELGPGRLFDTASGNFELFISQQFYNNFPYYRGSYAITLEGRNVDANATCNFISDDI